MRGEEKPELTYCHRLVGFVTSVTSTSQYLSRSVHILTQIMQNMRQAESLLHSTHCKQGGLYSLWDEVLDFIHKKILE